MKNKSGTLNSAKVVSASGGTVELLMNPEPILADDMAGLSTVVLSTAENVLCVPVAALDVVNGETVLYTGFDEKNASLGDPVPVTTGMSDAEYVQILGGLREGDTVYYAYYDMLESEALPSVGAMPFGNGRRAP